MAPRTAEEIGRTELGPRELPPLAHQRIAIAPSSIDTVLPNGLRVIAVRSLSVPMLELRLHIPFGGEDRRHPAIAEVLAETMLTGTARRDRVAVDTDLALVGGQVSAVVDPEALHIGGGALAAGVDQLLDVLADALTSAAYRDPEVARERSRLVERIAMARAQPGMIAREALQRERYGDHPYAHEVPEADDVASVTAQEVRALHTASVLPRGATLVLVGSLDPERVVSDVERAFADWSGDTSAVQMLALPPVTGGDLRLVHRPGAVQSQLRLSAQAVPRTDPRYPALQLANLAYGGYFSSRLVENIREDKGYTYHAHSGFEFSRSGATLLVDTDTATDVTAAALLEVRHELARLAVVPPKESETETVRRYAIGILATTTASQAGLASQLVALASVGLGAEWLAGHPARLEAVTSEEIAEVARVFYNPAAYTGVVVGDADVIGESLRVLGGVTLP
ncbi:MAG: M16 family metallopeptidase [Sciscionella sp.]